jgi:hypothetical protein
MRGCRHAMLGEAGKGLQLYRNFMSALLWFGIYPMVLETSGIGMSVVAWVLPTLRARVARPRFGPFGKCNLFWGTVRANGEREEGGDAERGWDCADGVRMVSWTLEETRREGWSEW